MPKGSSSPRTPNGVSQGPEDTEADKLRRLPNVLDSYAKSVEFRMDQGSIVIDSDFAIILRRASKALREQAQRSETAPTTNAAPQGSAKPLESPVSITEVTGGERSHTPCGAAPLRCVACRVSWTAPVLNCPECGKPGWPSPTEDSVTIPAELWRTALAALKEASPSAIVRTGFAIQHADEKRWRTMDSIGMPDWTDDPAKALVCRLREHVDAYAADDPEDVRIVEVSW